MGCDIHIYVERKQVDGAWTWVPPPTITAFGDYQLESWYFGRNYTLFGYLADVRNELGWGTSRVRPISTPRGVPDDASPEYLKIVDEWGIDGHSHSYFTLRELVEAAKDEDRTVDHRGWVSPAGYAEFLAHGRPSSWSGGVGGGSVEHVSNDRMNELIVAHPELCNMEEFSALPGMPSYYTEIRWQTTMDQSLGSDWEAFMQRLKEFTYDDGSDVRAVFFFDN